jgi:hypothetical protein
MDIKSISIDVIGMIGVAAIILGLIVLFSLSGFDLTPVQDNHISKVVTVEGYANSFCKTLEGNSSNLNDQCKKLTKNNCISTSCCVYAKMDNVEGCMAGNESGPTFRFTEGGKTRNIDYFYFKNKCHGSKCCK